MNYSDKPWLKSYKLGPYRLRESFKPFPRVPVFKALDDAAANYPAKTAILFKGRSLTYKELKTQADTLARGLSDIGVGRGDKVCVFLPNCTEFILSDWAATKAGAAVVPTSTLRTDEGLVYEVGSSRARVVVCREHDLERVRAAQQKSDIEHIIVTPDDGYDRGELRSKTLPKAVHDFRELLTGPEAKPPDVRIDPEEDLCELAFTGGATGIPKGVMISHFNRYSNIIQGLPWLLAPFSSSVMGKASIYITVPLFHAFGHSMAQVAASWALRIILAPDPRDNEDIVATMREYRPFLVPTVPTQLMRMAQGKVGRMSVLCMSAAAHLPMEIREAIKKEIGNPVAEGYGLTETGPIAHINPSAFSKITGFMAQEKYSLGVPVPDTECRVVDPETFKEVPVGESGEVIVKGPQVMKGYWPEPGSGLDAGGWLHTGDIGSMDEEGYFYIRDRVKDMINVSGMKVYSTTVDEALFKHPGVLMAVAIGIPDPSRPGSERIMALVRLKDTYKERVTQEEIIAACREHLPPYAVPKIVEFRDDLPLTVTEKLWKKEVRDEVIAAMRARGEIKE
jgi:long-chain acyl-CoA synthetase